MQNIRKKKTYRSSLERALTTTIKTKNKHPEQRHTRKKKRFVKFHKTKNCSVFSQLLRGEVELRSRGVTVTTQSRRAAF